LKGDRSHSGIAGTVFHNSGKLSVSLLIYYVDYSETSGQMTYEKPKCEYENCEKDADVERKTVTIGEESRYQWYCFRHDWIVRASKDSEESVENNEDKK
jgi:hypothetical protein